MSQGVLTTTDFGLTLFGQSAAQARDAYRRFMAQASYASEDRLLEDTHPNDCRVLGSGRFMASLKLPPFRPRSTATLEQLAREICVHHQISLDDLVSPRRHASLMHVRREFVRRAVTERIANLRQAAEFLRRDPSAVRKAGFACPAPKDLVDERKAPPPPANSESSLDRQEP